MAFFQYPSYVGIKRVADRIRMYTREEVEHLLATNVSASGGLGEEEGSSSTNASRGDSRNARAWETSWHGWVCRHWTNEEWDEWLSQWE